MDTKSRCIIFPSEAGSCPLLEALVRDFPNTIFSLINDWQIQNSRFPEIPDVVLVDYETFQSLLHTVPNLLPSPTHYVVIRFDNTAILPINLNITYIDFHFSSMESFVSKICEKLADLGCK